MRVEPLSLGPPARLGTEQTRFQQARSAAIFDASNTRPQGLQITIYLNRYNDGDSTWRRISIPSKLA